MCRASDVVRVQGTRQISPDLCMSRGGKWGLGSVVSVRKDESGSSDEVKRYPREKSARGGRYDPGWVIP